MATEPQTETPVLSQPQTEAPKPTPDPLPETLPPQAPPKEKTPEEKQKAREAYERRQAHRDYKNRLAQIQNETAEEETNAVLAEAKNLGFDIEDPATKKNAELIARTNRTQQQIRDKKAGLIKSDAARSILSDTLAEIGYEPGSNGMTLMGTMLFRTVGVDNPDVYADRSFVESKIKEIAAATAPKKSADPVSNAVQAKAGAPRPTSEPRNPPKPAAENDPVRQVMNENPGMERATAEFLIKQQANLPKHLRKWGS